MPIVMSTRGGRGVLLAVCVLVAVVSWRRKFRRAAANAESTGTKPPRAAQWSRLKRLESNEPAVTGTLAAEDQVTASFKVTGRLEALGVDLGSTVSQGQVLAASRRPTALRVTQAEAALQQARARLGLTGDRADEGVDLTQTALVRQARAVLDQARLTRDRAATFAKRGIGSQADLDTAEANFRVSEGRYQDAIEEVRNRQGVLMQRRSELELAKQALSDSHLRAPFAGRVRERHATPGQYLAAGAPVVTIVKVHPLRLRLSIPEREASVVRIGQKLRVTLEGDPVVHEGRGASAPRSKKPAAISALKPK
jgi:multidrug resistance efflux pump